MKRLFIVKSAVGKIQNVDGKTYWQKKPLAKAARDSLGGIEAGYYVSKGPDHFRNYKG